MLGVTKIESLIDTNKWLAIWVEFDAMEGIGCVRSYLFLGLPLLCVYKIPRRNGFCKRS